MIPASEELARPQPAGLGPVPGEGEPNIYLVRCPATDNRYDIVHRAGIFLHEGHLTYKRHDVRTYTGHAIQCSASLARVCDNPPPTRPDVICVHPKETR